MQQFKSNWIHFNIFKITIKMYGRRMLIQWFILTVYIHYILFPAFTLCKNCRILLTHGKRSLLWAEIWPPRARLQAPTLVGLQSGSR